MSLSITKDVTVEFNRNGKAVLDISGWLYCVVHLVTPAGATTFKTSNDGGAVQGVSDGSPATATNFFAVQGIKVDDGSEITSLAASGVVKFHAIGQYIEIAGTTAAKVLVYLTKI